MKLSIILVNFNTTKDTLDCLDSLKKAIIPPKLSLHIVLVDNASSDNSVATVLAAVKKNKYKNLQFIVSDKNTGFTGGNNIGIRKAHEDNPTHILLLNNDTLVPKDFFQTLSKSSIREPKVGVLTPKIYFAKGFEFHKDRYQKKDLGKVIWSAGGTVDWDNIYGSNDHVDEVDMGQFTKPTQTQFATGACMLIKREVIDSVGIFDERYFLYLEDLELSTRIKEAGWKIVFDPSVYLWHKVSQSSGVGSSLNDYFITRNRLLFGSTYAGLRTKLALYREAIRFLFNGTKAKKIAVRDFFLRRFGKGSWLK